MRTASAIAATAAEVTNHGLALEQRGDWVRAATCYDRAFRLYLEARQYGEAEEMDRRARTCRSAAGLILTA